MQISIDLQEPFTYSIIPLIIVISLVLIESYYFIYLRNKNKKINIEEKNVKEIPEKNIKNILVIKNKYLNQLDLIENKYTNNKIELRKAYQMISEAIRLFVFEITDITTQNYSLTEIKKLNIPNIYELIAEYYEPEFASKSVGDFNSAINKARRVIKQWN